jgi:hypothetical protein
MGSGAVMSAEEVTNLIAEARNTSASDTMQKRNNLIHRLADALERSATETRGRTHEDATAAWYDHARRKQYFNLESVAARQRRSEFIAGFHAALEPAVAVVPEDPKPEVTSEDIWCRCPSCRGVTPKAGA